MSKIVNHLYGGTVDLIFEDSKHQYFIDGKQIRGVTSILNTIPKPWLLGWAVKVTVEKMEGLIQPGVSYDEMQIKMMMAEAKRASHTIKTSAGDLGKLVHTFLEQYIKGENPGQLVHEEARNSANRFLDWVKKYNVKFLLSEQMVYSKKYNYCGTLDFVCKVGDKLLLGDIKTSNQISKIEYGSQLAAYKMAREEEYGEKFDGCVLIRIGKKDAEFEQWDIDSVEIKKYEKIFLKTLDLTLAMEEVE